MGFWSRLKKAVKKAVKAVVRVVKAIVRVLVKIVVALVSLVIGVVGSLFLPWLEKKIRLQVCILHPVGQKELVPVQDAESSVQRAAQIIKDKFDAKILPYGKPHVEIIREDAPNAALDLECSFTGFFGSEFGEAGDFYSRYTAGWNAVPISLVYPITVFVVRSVTHDGDAWRGCSFGLLADYVVITPNGIADSTTLAHEIAHSCSLLHRDDKANLMYREPSRGTSITGWQRYWFRTSRHVNFW
jgi:hypothetical protein